ncbi:MAG TPA: hypothetical protein VFG50_08330 [Rhodothermales bacterium]|nr:hypothetical protein [Rhodothermales bacterium]
METLTDELLRHFAALPVRKRAAILELLRTEASSREPFSTEDRFAWKDELRTASTWTDEEVGAIEQAHACGTPLVGVAYGRETD